MLHNKFWQGFFALAPLITLFIALLAYFIFLFFVFQHMPDTELAYGDNFGILGGIGIFIILIAFAVLLSIASLVFFIVHAVQNPNLKENNLLLVWILLFFFANGIGQLVYWLVEIVTKRKTHPE